jgi:hypothetical protein
MAGMAIALRCFAIAALGILLLPPSALAGPDVTRDATSGLITVTDFGGQVADTSRSSRDADAGSDHTRPGPYNRADCTGAPEPGK